MDGVRQLFDHELRRKPALRELPTIISREHLFQYLTGYSNNTNSFNIYTTRIDGALECLSDFAELAKQCLDTAAGNRDPRWEAMIWGSSALILAELYRRSKDTERIMNLFEDLTLATELPCKLPQQHPSAYSSKVVHLFTALAPGLLQLASELSKNPYGKFAFSKATCQSTTFEKEHTKAMDLIKAWVKRLSFYAGTPAIPTDTGTVQLSKERIPVGVTRHFKGRVEELEDLVRQLSSTKQRPAVTCINGYPGIGKTQLAARYCKQYGDQYFACIWVSADSPTKIKNTLSECAVKMQLKGASMEAEPSKNARFLKMWLEQTDQPWLLVLDNVDEPEHLDDFWPHGGGGHIIMTSRSPYIAKYRQSEMLELSPLSLAKSKELFFSIVGEDKEQESAQDMNLAFREWGGSPLALCHIGSYIDRFHMDIPCFLALYRQQPKDVYQKRHSSAEYPHSIATAFSIDKLEDGPKSLLRVLCYFDPDKIPIELLLSSSKHSVPIVPLTDSFSFYEALDGLCSSGLVSHTDKYISIHRLVQSVGFYSMEDADKVELFGQVVSLLDRSFPREVEGKPTWSEWSRCNTYLPHVLFLRRRWEELSQEGQKNANFASLLGACTWYMVERGLFSEVEPLINTAKEACPEIDESRLTLARILFNLAGVRFECNRIKESLELCQEVLDIRSKVLSPLDPVLGNTLYSIGIVYMEDGQLDKALASCLEAVHIHEECQKSGKHDGSPTGLSCLDVGLCYWKQGKLGDDAEGKREKLELASEYIERGLGLFKETTGEQSQKHGQGLSYLALVREAQGDLEEARKNTELSLKICEEITPDEFKTGLGLHKMAGFLLREKEYDKALGHIRRAIKVLEGTFDPGPRVARSMFKMSQILDVMGRPDEATVKRQEAMRLRSTITTFEFDMGVTEEAFDTLIPSFLG
ncbi:hypothetical protein PG997_014450 [Apiospora hydei]|uniref:NB-ARC domain-containing protein n=1 Tax=Apiospora hydei TaxID=1337664 RepID=A0ABR1UTV2_9PEZI